MSSLLNIFRPAANSPEIQDQEIIKSDYKYWRVRILYSTLIGYALYYFTRKSFTFAMPGLIEDLHFDKADLGLIGSILYISYGVSKFANGIISDLSSPRYFMALGLILTGFCNILFGMSSSFIFLAIFWGLNGWFQGFGWPPCTRFLTQWYSQNERGSWWSTWSIAHNVGAFTIPWIVGASLYFFDWRFAMFVPGAICILGGFFLINRLRDTPQSIGLPPIEVYRNDFAGVNPKGVDQKLTAKEIFMEYVVKNKYIWLLSFASFFLYVVRTGLGDWTALFLYEQKGYSRLAASGYVSIFEVGGFFGGLSAGWASDKLFGARRVSVCVLCAIGILISVSMFWFVPKGYSWLDSSAIFLMGFMVFGPQVLIGVAAAELSHKNAAATATGFAGCFGYMGAAMSGYPLGKITQLLGWDMFFIVLILCCVCLILFLAPMWSVKEYHRPVVPLKDLKKGDTPEFA
ncbi:MAG: MFS transporter [Parachlamydiaceae bacterium]|nr:MFS transporter [Parachlamydiaceae bacterium]